MNQESVPEESVENVNSEHGTVVAPVRASVVIGTLVLVDVVVAESSAAVATESSVAAAVATESFVAAAAAIGELNDPNPELDQDTSGHHTIC